MPEPMGAPKSVIRCMGGRWCSHQPGTCTATSGAYGELPAMPQVGALTPLEQHHAAVAAARDPAEEAEAEAIAYGLYALEAPLGSSLTRGWDRLDQHRRGLFIARGRLVRAMAADYRRMTSG